MKRFDDGVVKSAQDLSAVKKLLRVIACGARLVMREFARLKEVSEGDAKETRQLSIVQFVREQPVLKAIEKKCPPVARNAPPDSIWLRSSSAGRTLRWPLADGLPDAQAGVTQPRVVGSATGERCAKPGSGSRKPRAGSKWKAGLNWFAAKPK